MFIFDGMKINKFKDVRIPKKAEYFSTGRYIEDKGFYTGENAIEAGRTRKDEVMQDLCRDVDKQDK